MFKSKWLFKQLWQIILKYRILILSLAVLLCIYSIYYTATHLTFNPNRDDLVGEGEEFRRLSSILAQEFNDPGDMVVVVEGGQEEQRRKFTEELAKHLKSKPHIFTDIFYKLDLRFLKKKGFLFLPKPTLEKIAQQVEAAKPLYSTISKSEGLSGLLTAIYKELKDTAKLEQTGGSAFEEFIPALERIFRQMASSLRGHLSYTPLWESPVSKEEQEKIKEIPDAVYTTLQDDNIYILTVKPKLLNDEFSPVHEAIASLRTTLKNLTAKYPELKIGLTGEPILEDDEMIASEQDSLRASVLSLIAIAILFIVGFKSISKPLFAIVTLIIGIGWTLGFATVSVGHLNLLTVTFLPMIMGLGIDFGIQLIGRYEEELSVNSNPLLALESAITCTGSSLVTAGTTNAMGFFAAMLTPFNGVRELGIIAGGGILLCLIAMITVLPALLLVFENKKRVIVVQNKLSQSYESLNERKGALLAPIASGLNLCFHYNGNKFNLSRIEKNVLKYPKRIVLAGLILTFISIIGMFFIKFDYNLLHMQSQGLESVAVELRLIAQTDKSVLYASMITASLEKASQLKTRLEKLSTVAGVESPTPLLPEEYKDKLALAKVMYRHLRPVDFNKSVPENVDWNNVLDITKKLRHEFELIRDKIIRLEEFQIADSVTRLIDAMDIMLREADTIDSATARARLSIFQHLFFADLQQQFSRLKKEVSHPITPMDLPLPFRKRFLSKSGKLYMIQIFPKENIWERPAQERFISDLRKVDMDVTGTPITMYEYINLLMRSYKLAGIYALSAIIVLFLLYFKKIKSVGLVLVPLSLGFLWLLGIMGICNIKFNPANFVTLPLLIGIGVANGVYVVQRFQEERVVYIFSKSTGRAILLSALTTMAGFASLMLASHQGIASLGLIMTLGIITTLIATLLFLPALLFIIAESYKVNT